MEIAIIGGGNVGAGLAGLWRNAGHETKIVGRDDSVSESADAVLLAVPAGNVAALAAQRAGELAGRVVIDASNDVSGEIRSIAGDIAAAAPEAKLVKAFNTFFASIYDQIEAAPGAADMAYCSDDGAARETTATLIADAGFNPIDCGGLEAAPDLEGFARMVIRTAYSVGRGPFGYRFAPPAELGASE